MNTLSHLTDDEFAECVLTEPNGATATHLASCPECALELEKFSATMQAFHATAVGWSEAQPSVSLRAVEAAHPRLIAHPGFRWALASVLVVAAAAPVVLHGDRFSAGATASVQGPAAVPDDSPDEIAADNRLMERVNLALSVPDPSPVDEYGLSTQSNSARRATLGVRSQ
jgi:anti-sigma factor RsiW